MAHTEDYYTILEVDQTAARELIIQSYKRLALKLHPDHNPRPDATEAFQRVYKIQLLRAYETLKHETERRAYDLIYPPIKAQHTSSQNTQRPYPTSTPTPQSESASEAAQIATLLKAKQERAAQWSSVNSSFDSSIFEIKRVIRRLQQEIQGLNSVLAAEAAEEAQRNSWTTWLLSPLYKKAEVSEEEKARKDRERQERRIQKDMKERRLSSNEDTLKSTESLQRRSKAEIDAANQKDDRMIQDLRMRIRTREARQRQEKERAEYDRMMKEWKMKEELRLKKEREAAEVLRQQQAAKRAADQKRQEEEARRTQKMFEEMYGTQWGRHTNSDFAEGSTSQPRTAGCLHGGWWDKVHGRTACPECYDIWNYLLSCPGCSMKACPKCQAAIRPKFQRKANRRAPPRNLTPSPDFGYTYDW